jgi:hypothetical protein
MLRNLTPHRLNIVLEIEPGNLMSIPLPSEGAVRIEERRVPVGRVDGVPLTKVVYGAITGLPDNLAVGDVLIVSLLCVPPLLQQALPAGVMLCSPGPEIRNDEGVVTGCEGLTFWARSPLSDAFPQNPNAGLSPWNLNEHLKG